MSSVSHRPAYDIMLVCTIASIVRCVPRRLDRWYSLQPCTILLLPGTARLLGAFLQPGLIIGVGSSMRWVYEKSRRDLLFLMRLWSSSIKSCIIV